MLTEEEYSNEYDLDGIRSKKVSVVTKYNINSGSGGGTVMSGGDSIQAGVKPPISQPEIKLISKTTKTHTYLTQNGKVMRDTLNTTVLQTKITRKTEILDFIYDESGRPFALIYTNGADDPVTYYYVLNLQGDVVALTDDTGAIVAEYVYNAWGEKLHILDSDGNEITSSSNIAIINPLRYRGYYYDTETGFYYLQSRYYDPANHRFINADGLASTGQGFLGTNMFAYCRNNPIHRTDKSGNYDRDEAIEYAKKWYDDANTNDYQFFGGRGGDCTNFTSQCLFAGGIKKTKGWYCHKSSWLNPVATFFSLLINKTPYCWSYSKSWKFADDQFKFFSSKDNGIINGSVLKITSKDELKNVASYCNVQKGDL